MESLIMTKVSNNELHIINLDENLQISNSIQDIEGIFIVNCFSKINGLYRIEFTNILDAENFLNENKHLIKEV